MPALLTDHIVIGRDSETYRATLAMLATLLGGGGGTNFVKLATDFANSKVTLSNVTGMSFTALPNTNYSVDLDGFFKSAATTTGIAVALSVPAGAGVSGFAWHPVSTTGMGSVEQVATAATTGATTGVRAATTNVPLLGRWRVTTGATGGLVQLMWRSEIAASAVTLKAGSVMEWAER